MVTDRLIRPAFRNGIDLSLRSAAHRHYIGMVQFQLNDPEPLLFHTEPVFRDGQLVGYLTSGNYGHHLGAAIGLGYVETEIGEKPADVLASAYEIEVAGVRVKAQASMKPLYDPKSERIRA